LISLFLLLPILLSPGVVCPPPDDHYVALTNYSKSYTLEGNFLDPVFGPSSPKAPNISDGRLWIIIAHDTGLIEMNAINASGTPFDPPNATPSFRIQDFGLSAPLSNVLYMVPGRNRLGQLEPTDDLSRNGLLAFVANGQLVFLEPFQKRIFGRRSIGFQPTWLIQDVVSAGEMYDFPMQMHNSSGGEPCERYIVAANQTHFTLFRVDYRSDQDNPVLAPGDPQEVASIDMPLSGMPLLYFARIQPKQSAIYVPTANDNLAIFSMDGVLRLTLPLSLQGDSAHVSGPIGYGRAPEAPMIYVPLGTAARGGILYLYPVDVPAADVVQRDVLVTDPGCYVSMLPDPANDVKPYFACSNTGSPGFTRILRGLANGTVDPDFRVDLEPEARSFFLSPTTSQVMALDTAGVAWSVILVEGQQKVNFFGNADPHRTHLMYLGDAGGSRYSITSSPSSMLGFMFESSTGNATVFKLTEQWIPPENGGLPQDSSSLLMLVTAAAVITIIVITPILLRIAGRPPREHPPPMR
jgi:hypothetical protein